MAIALRGDYIPIKIEIVGKQAKKNRKMKMGSQDKTKQTKQK